MIEGSLKRKVKVAKECVSGYELRAARGRARSERGYGVHCAGECSAYVEEAAGRECVNDCKKYDHGPGFYIFPAASRMFQRNAVTSLR